MKSILLITILAALTNLSFGYFWTQGNKLMDSNGKPFIAKGINVASADWDATYKPWKVMKAVGATGANAVRILWLRDDEIKKKGLNDNDLVEVIKQAINNKLIPMVHLWIDPYQLGESNWDQRWVLQQAGQWWVSKLPLLKQFEDKLLINVLNEWSTWKRGRAKNDSGFNLSDFLFYADDAIIPIRKAGWQGTLVIDTLGMAQSPHPILQYGQKLIDKDPKRNLIFSVHAYADWREEPINNDYTPYDKNLLAEISRKNIPLILGEFSDSHPDSLKAMKYMNARKLMQICKDNNIGWLAWSWKGNGVVNGVDLAKVLDISFEHENPNLTDWGKLVAWDQNGLKTAQKATVF